MKKIEITLEEAKLLDGELFKVQLELSRKRWSADEPPRAEDIQRSKAVNNLREKIINAIHAEVAEELANGI
jgi:hypothetical protein